LVLNVSFGTYLTLFHSGISRHINAILVSSHPNLTECDQSTFFSESQQQEIHSKKHFLSIT